MPGNREPCRIAKPSQPDCGDTLQDAAVRLPLKPRERARPPSRPASANRPPGSFPGTVRILPEARARNSPAFRAPPNDARATVRPEPGSAESAQEFDRTLECDGAIRQYAFQRKG